MIERSLGSRTGGWWRKIENCGGEFLGKSRPELGCGAFGNDGDDMNMLFIDFKYFFLNVADVLNIY